MRTIPPFQFKPGGPPGRLDEKYPGANNWHEQSGLDLLLGAVRLPEDKPADETRSKPKWAGRNNLPRIIPLVGEDALQHFRIFVGTLFRIFWGFFWESSFLDRIEVIRRKIVST